MKIDKVQKISACCNDKFHKYTAKLFTFGNKIGHYVIAEFPKN